MENIYLLSEQQRKYNFERLQKDINTSGLPSAEKTAWNRILQDLQLDSILKDGSLTLGLMDAPAGKGMHHAYLGGLVVHLLEMIRLAALIKPVIFNQVSFSCGMLRGEPPCQAGDYLSMDDVLRVILLHDLHKAEGTFVVADGKLAYAKNSALNYLTTNMQSLSIAGRHFNYLTNKNVLNALESSEGGWAKNPPRSVTPLAKFCYLLDEMSANVVSPIVDPRA